MAMFDGLINWKATGAGAGAMAGMRAPYDLAQAQIQQRLQGLEADRRQFELGQAQEDAPYRSLVRENLTEDELEKKASRSQINELTQSTRSVGIDANKLKLEMSKLEKARAQAQWHLMADQFLDQADPASLAGEGYEKIRDSGRELGLPLPDRYTPEFRAKVKGAAQVAVKTVEYLGKEMMQRQELLNNMVLQGNKAASDAEAQGREFDFRRGENAQDRLNRLETARIAANARMTVANQNAGAENTSLTRIEGAALKKFQEAGIEALTEGEVNTVVAVYLKMMGKGASDTLFAKMQQLQAVSNDPVKAEQAKQELKQLFKLFIPSGDRLAERLLNITGGSASPTSPPAVVPSKKHEGFSAVETTKK